MLVADVTQDRHLQYLIMICSVLLKTSLVVSASYAGPVNNMRAPIWSIPKSVLAELEVLRRSLLSYSESNSNWLQYGGLSVNGK